jgi:hypothetical protein
MVANLHHHRRSVPCARASPLPASRVNLATPHHRAGMPHFPQEGVKTAGWEETPQERRNPGRGVVPLSVLGAKAEDAKHLWKQGGPVEVWDPTNPLGLASSRR